LLHNLEGQTSKDRNVQSTLIPLAYSYYHILIVRCNYLANEARIVISTSYTIQKQTNYIFRITFLVQNSSSYHHSHASSSINLIFVWNNFK
jgi:hypothetical protein